MDYPEHDTYSILYARYLAPARTAQLVELAGPLEKARILDLCGGGGRLARYAAGLGAEVLIVDESAPMSQACGVQWLHASVEKALPRLPCNFDAVLCQQAVNYWMSLEMAEAVARVLKAGGRFVFNTFNRKPSAAPSVKQYVLNERHYAEISWLRDGFVEHVQTCEGYPPHTTRFQWISPEMFQAWLGPWFEVTELQEGATSVWVCIRKGSCSAL